MFERFQFYFKHSLNDLRVNGQRTFFALLCIAAGVAAIVSLQTLGVMINDTLTGSLQEVNKSDFQIQSGFSFEMDEAEPDNQPTQRDGVDEGILEDGGQFSPDYFGETGLQRIQEWLDANYPGSTLTYEQILQTGGFDTTGLSVSAPDKDTSQIFVMAYVIDPSVYPLYGERRSQEGELLSELLQEPNDIVISENLADTLEAEVGDILRISGASTDFTLRGIVDTAEEGGFEGALFGYYYIDQSARQFFNNVPMAATRLYVKLADPAQTVEAARDFENAYPYLATRSTADVEDENSQVSDAITDLVTIMGLISLLIGGIGIINTMLVIVSRRATEVAVLKTLGLKPEEVTILFLVEAVLMGIIGSIFGILLGWLMAYLTRGIAGRFVAQELTFHFALEPALTGFVVGILITTIFGFLPTLVAGQVRPAIVLRPSDNVMPRAGRLLSFVALLLVMIALSLLTRGLIGQLLTASWAKYVSAGIGFVFGGLIGVSMLFGQMMAYLTGRNIVLRALRWLVLLVALPIAGAAFGYSIPALLVVSVTFLLMGVLYIVLWLLIWAVGGGRLDEFPLLGYFPVWARWIILFVPPFLFFTLLILPFRFIGWLLQLLSGFLQRFGLVDLKIAMRSMLASKGRGASTLLALVVGVFTLSVITMLVDTITKTFEEILENELGGNVIIAAGGGEQVLENINTALAEQAGVRSYAVVGSYNIRLVSLEDTETGETRTFEDLKQLVREGDSEQEDFFEFYFQAMDARELDSNLPDSRFYEGRQLQPADAGRPVIVMPANEATLDAGFSVGDKLTFAMVDSPGETVTFEVVGMTDHTGGNVDVSMGSSIYAPIDSFPENVEPNQISAIVDIEESKIPELRRRMRDIPGAFMLETRFINDLVNRVVDQFTSFPIMVAALALFTGGIVIANSVALSMMERRREIGIMKAIGLQRERVLGVLLIENALMGFAGGIIGVGISFINLLLLLTIVFEGELGDTVPYQTAFALMGLCILISLGAALMSVWGASGEKPLNVLRYE